MTKTIRILSRNDKFQQIEVLKRNREKRAKRNVAFVEGVSSINLIVKNGWEVESFVYGDRKLSDWARNILSSYRAEVNYCLSDELMHALSEKEEPSELFAVVKTPRLELSKLDLSGNFVVAVLDRPSSPGNLGSIIRSCDAFGVNAVLISGHSVDLYDPVVIRASVGTVFSGIPIHRVESGAGFQAWVEATRAKAPRCQLVGTTVKTENLIHSQSFRTPLILVFGNETYGMSSFYSGIVDCAVKIPIFGAASSLNLANAVSIFLYEVQRQRFSDPPVPVSS